MLEYHILIWWTQYSLGVSSVIKILYYAKNNVLLHSANVKKEGKCQRGQNVEIANRIVIGTTEVVYAIISTIN